MEALKSRRTRKFCAVWISLLIALVLTISVVAAPLKGWINGKQADGVLGQSDFTSNSSGITSSKLNHPYDIAIDSVNGKVFISDYNNHRVLRFDSVDAATNGAAAEAVLGQADFTSNQTNRGGAVGVNTLYYPMGICIDSSGRLWVADSYNNRVLAFENASNKANGANADRVLGQANFTMGTPNLLNPLPMANSMNTPTDVSCDPSGRLWVVDSRNSRVLRFDNVAGAANGANADGVLGQPDFVSMGIDVSQNGMYWPIGVSYTPTGELFVSDWLNHRVLRFDSAASKANGANADGVLGQPDFTSNTTATTAYGMRFSRGVEVDSTGALYVSESSNHRVLIFENAAAKANGASADYVLGQADFTSGSANRGGSVTANTVNSPRLLYYDRNTDILWLSDQTNNRILRWENVTASLSASSEEEEEETVSPDSLPVTGFPLGKVSELPEQLAEDEYQSYQNDLRLEIPALDIETRIVGVPRSGESWNLTWLDDEAGWLEGTAYPTWSGNSVLTAHVVNANGQPGLFADLRKLKWGDRFSVKVYGQEYIYEVRSVDRWVSPDDVSVLGHEDYPWLTLVTCSGYDKRNENYRWRVVVKAVQVEIK